MEQFKKDLINGLYQIIIALLSMAGSKKFLAAVSASLIIWQQSGDAWAAIAPIMVYILAQGFADFGKERA